MTKTIKTSINAIIFVTIYFLFIIFISLLKGINLYNIQISNIKINHLFVKLKNKFIITAENIYITTSKKNYNKQALKLHKIFYFSSKILPIFKKIDLKNIYENEIKTFKNISIYKNHIYINSNDIYAIGNFKINNNNSFLFLKKLIFKDYKFTDIKLISYLNNNYALLNINLNYQNNPIYIVFKITDQKIINVINFQKISFNYQNNKALLKNCYLNGKIFLNEKKIYQNGECNTITIQNNFYLNAINNKIKLNNKFLTLFSKKISFKYNDLNISKSNINNLNLIYSIKEKNFISDAKSISLTYIDKKPYKIKANNIALNYNLKNQNIFLYAKKLYINNDINATSNEILFYKTKKIYFLLNKNKLLSKFFNLKNNIITGNSKIIQLSSISGKILKFNTFIKDPKINLNKKYVKTSLLQINDINLTNNIFTFKKPFIFKTHTNTLLNNNVKEIANYFNIKIPLLQYSGKNDINSTFIFWNKNKYDINYSLISSFANFYTDNNFSFSYKQLKIKGDLNQTNILVNNFIFPYQYLNSDIDSNITINIKEKYINSFMFIKKLNIYKYLQIKNFNEKIVIDLMKNYLFALNSAIFINLNNKTIYFYDLKRLLNYSPFKLLFNSGEAIIKLLKEKINIYINSNLNYPLILNQQNPKNLKADITINLNTNIITIQNSHMFTNIINFEKVKSDINNIDISIPGLINIIKNIQKITEMTTEKNNKENNFSTEITAKNTNFIYKNHKFLTQKAYFKYKKEIKFKAIYKQSKLTGYTKNNYLLIEGKNYNKEALIPLLSFFNHFYNINLDFVMVRSPDDFYTGKIFINRGVVKDLAALNNIIAFINTIPSLLSFQAPGFSAKGYKIKKGFINFLFYNNILYLKQIDINGYNLGFEGKGYIDLNKNLINLKLDTKVKFKLKNIPIIGKGLSYLFFGKDGYLHIKILIKGDLNNPQIEKDLGTNIIKTPINLIKRILTLPFHIF